ncbi:DNA-binding transcriptional regulator, MarR family [Catalinimonas alkaloidigena]|uniref:DNA-binding transcriptional regulator, MarR family n=1 Tax=Catalinimonas alkaloidigena TaxID=1075417 RepID=A0A1G9ACJ1_9BACT|nr:MarR family transcriptional regulator [Catalinimonas alkaloidigena]SDK24953.1 DNA-binding transcriptional regulator, MarR family [Catalinimonas alkaloidigena]
MDDTLLSRLRKLNQRYAFTSLQMHEAIARKAGLSGTDHKYLGFLMQKGQMTAGELATLTGLTTGAVTGLIDRFEKRKLVKRQFSPDDRRKVIIVPDTQKIMALLAPLYRDYRTRTDDLIASFSEEELQTIETFFTKAIDLMNDTVHRLTR